MGVRISIFQMPINADTLTSYHTSQMLLMASRMVSLLQNIFSSWTFYLHELSVLGPQQFFICSPGFPTLARVPRKVSACASSPRKSWLCITSLSLQLDGSISPCAVLPLTDSRRTAHCSVCPTFLLLTGWIGNFQVPNWEVLKSTKIICLITHTNLWLIVP